MSEFEEGAFQAVELENQTPESSEAEVEPPSLLQPPSADPQPLAQSDEADKEPVQLPNALSGDNRWMSAVEQFKLKRFFVLRPGTLNQCIEDITKLVDRKIDGIIKSFWLMAEVDHWNNEKERVVVITDNSLLVCKYDFVMLHCEQIQRVPLNYIDRICHGTFAFPQGSLIERAGEGVRVFWDRLREPSFTSRWNPFSTDYPYNTFTYHPARSANEKFAALCEIQNFREELREAAERAHSVKPTPGKANGVLVLNKPIFIETYVGLMSFIGNQNKLGYCLARGHIGL